MKCRNEKFMSTVGFNKVNKNTEVDFDVQRNLPDCQKMSAGKHLYANTGASFDRFKIPKNQFECMRGDCVNTGTLYASQAMYRFKLDAEEFAAGVLTFYVLPPAASASTVVVRLSDELSFTNADQYTITLADLVTGSDGFKAVIIDLTQTPTEVGTGWSKTGNAVYVDIVITGGVANEVIGISTLAMFESMDDFAVSTHVIARCPTGVDGSFDLDVAEQTCFKTGEFDTTDLSGIEKTVTFRAITPNYWRLNPMYNKGKLTKAWDKEAVEVKVETLEDTDYGYVTLEDLDQKECGFVSIQVLYDCRDAQNIADALLERLSVPNKVDLDEDHFQMLDAGNGKTMILFNKVHINRNVLISYPKVVDVVDSFDISDENVNELRTRMTYTKCYTDGTKYRFVYNNVLITSFPDALSEDDDAEGELTINIQRDADGKFGHAYRILG